VSAQGAVSEDQAPEALTSENAENGPEARPLTEPSLTGEGEKGRRGEGENVVADAPPAPTTKIQKTSKGSRLTSSWLPTQADRTYAESLGFTTSQIASIAEKFRDYWIAKPGAGGVKLDWEATWRNWVRRENENPHRPKPGGRTDLKPWEM
jgi:hypothetical protein